MEWVYRIWRLRAVLRGAVALLGFVALAVMPVRAMSVSLIHHQIPSQTMTTMDDMADADCPLHKAASPPTEHRGHGQATHDGAGKGAGPCCVAWCVAIALPSAQPPVLFPPPARLMPPASLVDHDGRHPSPPLRPPRG